MSTSQEICTYRGPIQQTTGESIPQERTSSFREHVEELRLMAKDGFAGAKIVVGGEGLIATTTLAGSVLALYFTIIPTIVSATGSTIMLLANRVGLVGDDNVLATGFELLGLSSMRWGHIGGGIVGLILGTVGTIRNLNRELDPIKFRAIMIGSVVVGGSMAGLEELTEHGRAIKTIMLLGAAIGGGAIGNIVAGKLERMGKNGRGAILGNLKGLANTIQGSFKRFLHLKSH
jgi:hypothetical protein